MVELGKLVTIGGGDLKRFSKKAIEIFLVTAAVIGWGIILIAKPFKKKKKPKLSDI